MFIDFDQKSMKISQNHPLESPKRALKGLNMPQNVDEPNKIDQNAFYVIFMSFSCNFAKMCWQQDLIRGKIPLKIANFRCP